MENFQNNLVQDVFISGVVEQIVRLAKPISIYIFGSTARGENKRYSDLDFLVLIPEDVPMRKTAQLLYKDVDSKLVSCDFIVTTKTILEKNKNKEYMIYHNALKDCILLYGK